MQAGKAVGGSLCIYPILNLLKGSKDAEQRMEKMEEPNRPAFPAKPVLHVRAVWFGVWHLPSLSPIVLTCKVVLNIPTKGP